MSFWDSSALVPLCINEDRSQSARRFWRHYRERHVLRESVVEIESAIARLEREGNLDSSARPSVLKQLTAIELSWIAVETSARVIELARTFPANHGLRSLDSLQLAAALVWCKEFPKDKDFIAADEKLLKAAEDVGFTIHNLL